jgi:osmotically-inducible protein OsmY
MSETVTPPRADWKRQTKVRHAEASGKITIRSERLEDDPPRKRFLGYQALPRLSGNSATADKSVVALWRNLITVKPRLKPRDVKEKIEQALIRSAKTDADRITVDVEGSTVTVRGTVRSFAEKEEAQRAAWQAPGVISVKNQIKVSCL